MTNDKLQARFWSKVDKTETCWNWTAATDTPGYGRFYINGRLDGAHRVSYELHYGVSLSREQYIDHTCHNKVCVNPSHLRLTTNKENIENRGGLNKNNTSGYRGVEFDKTANKWRARLRHNYRRLELGYFKTKEEAAEAIRLKRIELFTHNDKDRE